MDGKIVTMDGSISALDSKLGGRLDKLEGNIEEKFQEMGEEIDHLQGRVQRNEKALEGKIQKVIDRQPGWAGGSGDIEKKIEEVLTKKVRSTRAFLHPQDRAANQAGKVDASREAFKLQKEGAYWAARKSLRMWPVQGPDLYDSAVKFLVDFMQQDPRSLPERDEMSVQAAGSIGKTKNQGEVVVRFPDVATRDAVRSAAFHLAGKQAGIRLEIPDMLRPSLRALENAAFNLKKTNPGMKRNVKFDDAVLDLVMDVKLHDNAPWRKIRPAQALAAKMPAPQLGVDTEEMGADELQSCYAAASASSSSGNPATGANATPQGDGV